MKKKTISIICALTLALSALMGCGQGTDTAIETVESTEGAQTSVEADASVAAETEKPSDIKFGFIVGTLDGVFTEFSQNLEKECKAQNIEYIAKEAYNVNDKITAIENLTLAGCNVLLLQVDDKDALEPYIVSAQEQGVKFINLDTATDTNDASYVCANYDYGYAIGTNAANWINETFDTDTEVQVAICNAPFLPFLVERENGVRAAIAELAPNAVFVAEASAGANIQEGVTAGETWMQSYPDLKAVVAINDTGALGVYEAFKAAGKTGDDIGIFGGDAIADAITALNEGGIFRGTVSTSINTLAPEFVRIAMELVEKGSVENKDNFFPLIPITSENVAEFTK